MPDINAEDKKFVAWLEKTMLKQGRKWEWLSEKMISLGFDLPVHKLGYKREKYRFTVDEEAKIKEILEP